jgi:hypothetical protein
MVFEILLKTLKLFVGQNCITACTADQHPLHIHNLLSRQTMNHFSCTQKNHILSTQWDSEAYYVIKLGHGYPIRKRDTWVSQPWKLANGSRTALIDCNYKTRLKLKRDPKLKLKMKKRNGGLALPRNPCQLSNTNQYSSGILVYVCCI